MNRILYGISRINTVLGHLAAWLILIMVLCQFSVVVLRYVFGVGSLILQESVVYMFGASFMLGAALLLIEDGHVRVDIFYQGATKRWQRTVDFWGSLLFLLPVSAIIFWTSLPYVGLSWSVLEGSQETSGIPGVFLFKQSSQFLLRRCSCRVSSWLSKALLPSKRNRKSVQAQDQHSTSDQKC